MERKFPQRIQHKQTERKPVIHAKIRPEPRDKEPNGLKIPIIHEQLHKETKPPVTHPELTNGRGEGSA